MAFYPYLRWHADPAAATKSLSALDVAKAYKFPTDVTGKGATIALIELGGGYKQSDLDKYFSGLGLPTPNVTSVSVSGANNSPCQDADAEVLLDIQVAGAVAPGAAIRVYFAPNTDAGFLAAINQAIADKVTVISISWGQAESEWSTASLKAFDAAFARAFAANIAVLVAAGDSGANDGERAPTADFPASSPNVIACGGTRLTLNADGSRAAEVVWNDSSTSAGGGGYSRVFTRPAYQPASVGNYRGVPDITGNADPVTGYRIIINGQAVVIGGTSAVAPLFAGLIALLFEKNGAGGLASLGQTAYLHPQLLFDVVTGNNRGYSAAASWDAASGMGVPIGAAWASFLVPVTPAPPVEPVPPAQPTPPPVEPTPTTLPDGADLALAAAMEVWLNSKGIAMTDATGRVRLAVFQLDI